ncbi:hypothetical protein TSOC_002297, partial [Tetrabaena socialis]
MPLRQSGQWLVVGAWGWGGVAWSEEDMLGLLGGMQRELRGLGCPAPAYVVQGPGTTEEQQRELGFPFGVPALLDIAQAGVAMHAPATIYTNLAAAEHLGAVLRRLRAPAERCGHYKARFRVAGSVYTLLSTKSEQHAALAFNRFRERLQQLIPACGFGPAPMNSIPSGVELSAEQSLSVERQVSAAAAVVWQERVARAAAKAAAAKLEPGAASLAPALRNLAAHQPALRNKLLQLLAALASGELPADSVLVDFALSAASNYVRWRRGQPTACRWSQRLKALFAPAWAQPSAERAVDIRDGTTSDPNIPVPSRITALRLQRAAMPAAGPFTGLSQERVAALVRR